jgi:hypothetical protein
VRAGWLVVAIAAAACRGEPPRRPLPPLPVSPTGIDRAVTARELDGLMDATDQLCACDGDACVKEVDGRLAELMRSSVLDDPLTDNDNWPADQDAMSDATFTRLVVCALDRDAHLAFFGVLMQREAEELREASCACADAGCAKRSAAQMVKLGETMKREASLPLTMTEEQSKAIIAAAGAAHDCTQGILGDQSLLDLKQLRDEACACTDADCAARVHEGVSTWEKDYETLSVDPGTLDRMKEIGTELGTCLGQAERGEQ